MATWLKTGPKKSIADNEADPTPPTKEYTQINCSKIKKDDIKKIFVF